jgi:hypothetical protein
MMKAPFFSAAAARAGLLAFSLVLALPAACLAADADDDECIYNPAAFKDMLAQLHHRYPGSRYTRDHRGVTLRQRDGKVTVVYGGCENYGTEIAFVSGKPGKYTQQAVFAKAVSLVREFGQGRVEPGTLQALLRQGKFTKDPDAPGVISVPCPQMDEFTIQVEQEPGRPVTIDVSFYN